MTSRESRWIGYEVREHLVYNGTSYLASFMVEVEAKVAPEQRLHVLDVVFYPL